MNTAISRKNSIVFRLLTLIVLVTTGIAVVATFVSVYIGYQNDLTALKSRVDQVQVSAIPTITENLWTFDEEQLEIQVNNLLQLEDVVKVELNWRDWNDIDRVFLAQSDEPISESVLTKVFNLVHTQPGRETKSLGLLTITADLSQLREKVFHRTIATAALQAVQTFFVAWLLLSLIRSLLTQHMETIARFASQVNLNNLQSSLQLNRASNAPDKLDELDNIVNAFNNMRENLLRDIQQKQEFEDALQVQKQASLESQRIAEVAESSNRAKSQFLATMSHEIRTPMNGVIGMVELLRDTELNQSQQHYLEVIHRSGLGLLDIINDILDFSKIEAGKLTLEKIDFSVQQLMEDSILLFATPANQKNLELISHLSADIPTVITGDPTRLRQLFINLLGNAFKFTETGSIDFEAKTVTLDECKVVIEFSVTDTGIGIKDEAPDDLFDSFNQADNSTTRKYGGTGLGLAICKHLSQLMNGEIGVTSQYGEGSRFWFTAEFEHNQSSIPLHQSLTHTKTASDEPNQTESPLNQKNLLLILSNPRLVRAISQQTQSYGMHTESATLETVNEKLERNNYGKSVDIMMIDHQWPSTTGCEFAQSLLPKLSERSRIIVVSNQDNPLDSEQMRNKRLCSWLRKPLIPSLLRLKLEELSRDTNRSVSPTTVHVDRYLPDISHLKILVAEDNNVNQLVIKGLLGRLKAKAELVNNGQEALQAVENSERPYDLIFMDCEMPVMDGFQATESIREYERLNNLPATFIVALTAHALEEHREAVIASGMNYFLTKPISLDRLAKTVEHLGLTHGFTRKALSSHSGR